MTTFCLTKTARSVYVDGERFERAFVALPASHNPELSKTYARQAYAELGGKPLLALVQCVRNKGGQGYHDELHLVTSGVVGERQSQYIGNVVKVGNRFHCIAQYTTTDLAANYMGIELESRNKATA